MHAAAAAAFPVTDDANRVFCVSCNPHSDNPSKCEGNPDEKPLGLGGSFTAVTLQMLKCAAFVTQLPTMHENAVLVEPVRGHVCVSPPVPPSFLKGGNKNRRDASVCTDGGIER